MHPIKWQPRAAVLVAAALVSSCSRPVAEPPHAARPAPDTRQAAAPQDAAVAVKRNDDAAAPRAARSANKSVGDAKLQRPLHMMARGDWQAAEAEVRTLVEQDPAGAAAHSLLGTALWKQHRHAEAVAAFRRALSLDSGQLEAALGLAYLLACSDEDALRDGAEAVRVAEQALARVQTPRDDLLDALAAAYAEDGRFDDAVRTIDRAIRLATRRGSHELLLEMNLRRHKYGRREAHRIAAGPAAESDHESLDEQIDEAAAELLELDDGRRLAVRLAWILATHPDPRVRDGGAALRMIEATRSRQGFGNVADWDALAAAAAELQRWDEALRAVDEAAVRHAAGGAESAVRARRRAAYAQHRAQRDFTLAPLGEHDQRPSSRPARVASALHLLAGELDDEHDPDRAARRLLRRRAVAFDPRSRTALLAQANALSVEGQHAEAVAHYHQALKLARDDPATFAKLGDAIAAAGGERWAIWAYARALRLEPDQSDVKRQLARLLATAKDDSLRDPPWAVELATSLCRDDGHRDPKHLKVLSTACAAAGRFDDALRAAQLAIDLLETSPSSSRAGRFDELSPTYELILKSYPDSAKTLEDLGTVRWQQGRLAEATALLARACRHAPGNVEPLAKLARLLATAPEAALRDTDEAVVLAQIAHALAPGRFSVQESLRIAYAAGGRFEGADESARPKLAGADGRRDRWIADISRPPGRLPPASPHRDPAARDEREEASRVERLAHLGALALQQGRPQASERHLRAALEAAPQRAKLRDQLARALAMQGRREEAGRVATRSAPRPRDSLEENPLEFHPAYRKYHLQRGVALTEQGDYAAAVRHLRGVVNVRRDADVLTVLGTAQLMLGRRGDARKHFTESLRHNPNDLTAANNLAWLIASQPDVPQSQARRAVQLAEQVCRARRFADPASLDTLAMAYAAEGRLDETVVTIDKAIGLLSPVENDALRRAMLARKQLYKAGKPFREGTPAKQ